uniref:Uncharacterized protein n=1 Tax=Oryza meridionalis TaxID=40149 RepID=A0A0E0C4W3_9ORYZ
MEKEVEEKLGGIYDGKLKVIVPSILQYVCTAFLLYERSSWCSSPRRPVDSRWEELAAWISDHHHAICKGGGGGRRRRRFSSSPFVYSSKEMSTPIFFAPDAPFHAQLEFNPGLLSFMRFRGLLWRFLLIHKCNKYSLWWEHFFLHNDEVVLVFQTISGEVVAAGLVSFLVFDGVSPRFD